MATENPFVYGEIVPASAFVDRHDELARLTADLAAGQKVFLISPRRYGKSSLVRQAMRQLARQKVLTLEITVSSFSSYVAFLEGFARGLVALETRADRLRDWIKELFGAVRPELRYDLNPATGKTQVAARVSPRSAAPATSRGWPRTCSPCRSGSPTRRGARLADRRSTSSRTSRRSTAEASSRRCAPPSSSSAQVGYVFAGSEPTLMERMIGPRRPFYKAGPVMRLQKIPADLFAASLDARFKKSGLPPEPGLGEAIVELGGNLPYDVQRLAHETWDDAARERPAGG